MADVIDAGHQFKYMSGYHLDFVICDEEANTIAAIELDDKYHDTKDGQRKDANKNRWLKEAGIQLLRFRTPEEARKIREKLKMEDKVIRQSSLSKDDFHPQIKIKQGSTQAEKILVGIVFLVAITWGVIWITNYVTQKIVNARIEHQKLRNTQAEQIKTIALQQEAASKKISETKQQSEELEKYEQAKKYEQALIKLHEIKVAEKKDTQIQGIEKQQLPFDSVYKKPKYCENPVSMDVMVECSNHYIREKKKYGNQ